MRNQKENLNLKEDNDKTSPNTLRKLYDTNALFRLRLFFFRSFSKHLNFIVFIFRVACKNNWNFREMKKTRRRRTKLRWMSMTRSTVLNCGIFFCVLFVFSRTQIKKYRAESLLFILVILSRDKQKKIMHLPVEKCAAVHSKKV